MSWLSNFGSWIGTGAENALDYAGTGIMNAGDWVGLGSSGAGGYLLQDSVQKDVVGVFQYVPLIGQAGAAGYAAAKTFQAADSNINNLEAANIQNNKVLSGAQTSDNSLLIIAGVIFFYFISKKR